MRVNLRGLIAGLLPLLLGCSDGTLKISNSTPEPGRIKGAVILRELEQAKSLSEIDTILTSLQKERGQRLDWPSFWRALSDKPAVSKRLLEPRKDLLLALHSVDCNPVAFEAFASFILKMGDDKTLSWLWAPLSKCEGQATPAIAEKILARTESLSRRDYRISVYTTLIAPSLSANPSPDWKIVFAKHQRDLETAGNDLLAEQETDAVIALAHSLNKAGVANPFETMFGAFLVQNPHLFDRLIAQLGFRGAVELLYQHRHTLQNASLPRGWSAHTGVTAITTHAFSSTVASADAWELFCKTRDLLLALTYSSGARSQLNVMNALRSQFSQWMKTQPFQYAVDLMADARNASREERLEALWLAYRYFWTPVAGIQPQILQELRESAALRSSDPALSLTARALEKRLSVFLASTMAQRKRAVRAYCSFLEEVKISGTTLSFDLLAQSGHLAIPAGCVDVYIRRDETKQLVAESSFHVRASLQPTPDTVIQFHGGSDYRIIMDHPIESGGIFDLSVPLSTSRASKPGDLYLIFNGPVPPIGFVSIVGNGMTEPSQFGNLNVGRLNIEIKGASNAH